MKARKHNLCTGCKAKWVEAGIERYGRIGEHLAASRKAGQKRDNQRRLRVTKARSDKPRSQEQSKLLYGMQMERKADGD